MEASGHAAPTGSGTILKVGFWSSVSLAALTFSRKSLLEKNLNRILSLPFILTLVSLGAFLVGYGVDRSYRFEVPAISFNWLVLILAGVMAAIYFRRRWKYVWD